MVLLAKNVILGSWHIWSSAEGWNDHIYANNAGTMMDRNLGATSAECGNVGIIGLFYQRGRYSPFMAMAIEILPAKDLKKPAEIPVDFTTLIQKAIKFDMRKQKKGKK